MVYHVILSFIDKAQFVYPTFIGSKKECMAEAGQLRRTVVGRQA